MAGMFSPEMIRMAQEQMSRMSAEEIANMQRMAATMDPSALGLNVSPEMARQAQAEAAKLSPEEMTRRMEQVKNMSPEELQRQMNGVQTQAAGTQQYMFNVRVASRLCCLDRAGVCGCCRVRRLTRSSCLLPASHAGV